MTTETLFLQGYKKLTVGQAYRMTYMGRAIRFRVIRSEFKDAKMRNAAGSMIPMPQTVVTADIIEG